MGLKDRERMLNQFDEKIVIKRYVEVIKALQLG
jgi:hypothetical protein